MSSFKNIIQLVLLVSLFVFSLAAFTKPICLYVSSYHSGYHWNDGIEAGLTRSLSGVCEVQQFYMDTKRNKGEKFATAKALEAKQLIDQLQPDVVIACDDSASKYLIVKHIKGTDIPTIFCGVNWTVKAYGYPYPNVTGMIEVAPIKPLINEAHNLLPKAKSIAFISADVPTQEKDAQRIKSIAKTEGLNFNVKLVNDFEQWKKAFNEVQKADIVVLGNPAGIYNWDQQLAETYIRQQTRSLTVSFGVTMSRHSIFAMINIPEEQGEWSALLAKQILSGESPADLPITANRRWQILVNPALAQRANIKLPERLIQNSIIVKPAIK
jgi:ABC-type uncharacterized transport system substrate-binding protein